MPKNPNKARCQHPGCRAWAVRDSSPPLCAAHGGRKGGAPPGNQNALTHGFYASTLTPYELADLDVIGQLAGDTTLDAEVVITRIALRRLLHMFQTGTTPGPEPQPLAALAGQAHALRGRLGVGGGVLHVQPRPQLGVGVAERRGEEGEHAGQRIVARL